jgi:hypothetical protein
MATARPVLEMCIMCQYVRDGQETSFERWITKQTYREEIGIDPNDCSTYCSACYKHLVSNIQAA